MNTNTELVVRSAKKNMVKCHVGMRNKNRRHCLFALSLALLGLGIEQGYAQVGVNQAVDYSKPNYANSPLLRKFVDSLPGLGVGNSNNLGQYIPVAVPDKATYPGADYYVLGVTQYVERMHSDLPATGTKLRGYVQLNSADPTVRAPHYLGPLIVAQRGTPVRILFTNMLPTSTAGNLFLPVDTTMMGAGTGPMSMGSNSNELYSQNRAEIHLHGGDNPWISDGTPHQWTTPAGEPTSYPKGVGVQDVPDMPAPGPGALTYYFPNNESARLMFYHDHSYGLTRLNVYAGEAAGYLLTDPVEQGLVTSGVIPSTQIPLIIQDKTFVPDPTTLAATDPLWNTAQWGGMGNLWFPHVYMPNQDPASPDGMNAKGRWDYGPWFWPPQTAGVLPGDLLHPTLPTISAVPESFMDTPVINGTAYPYVQVQPKAYRFRILNGCNDRYLNLQLYYADASGTEVKMVPAVLNTNYPATWPTDGRTGGVPDPATAGPNMVQIGTEAGLLPSPVVVTNTPIGYEYDRKSITVLNISTHALLLGSAERADVVIDFSAVPPGSKLILYNDAPAPVPAFDPRVDYYTDDPDFSVTGDDVGGAPSTKPGYGPNTRTLMQFRVAGTPVAPFNLPALQTALPSAFGASQPPLLVNTGIYARIQDQYMNTSGLPQALTNIILTQAGTAYTTPPTITFVSSSGSGAAATATLGPVTALALTFGGSNYITAPTVQITGGGGTGAAGVATITNGVIATLALTNAGSGYTANPTVTFVGGGGTNATATATADLGAIAAITLTNPGSGYLRSPEVWINGDGNGAYAKAVLANSTPMENKAIQELFDPYGRMNSTLAIETPYKGVNFQTTIPLAYIDPATEVLSNGQMQLWKITHNGVDTHAVHFHLVNVQVVNRVGWDGVVKPPDPNEQGWKETVRMNPLEDIIVALKPVQPVVPAGWTLPNSVRPLDVTMPLGSTTGFTGVDLNGNPVNVTNVMTDFGFEYVWHCHLLGHEENDMMRPLVLLSTNPVYNVTGTANPDFAGSVSGGGLFPLGANIPLTANAATGWTFANWSDGSIANPLMITVSATTTAYTANFSLLPGYGALMVVPIPGNGGTVTGSGTFTAGASAQITATPASSNWVFSAWSDGDTNATRTVVVAAGLVEYDANFAPVSFVNVVANPTNGGITTGTGVYPTGSNITISATATNGAMFTAWNDGDTNATRIITVPLGDITYTANFGQSAMVTGVANPANNGTVLGGGQQLVGATIWLTAVGSNGWDFTSWSDGVTVNPRAILVPATNVTYTATFAPGLGDALNAPGLTFTSGGNAKWIRQTATTHDGVAAAQSGAIGEGQETWIETTTNGPATISFWWKTTTNPGDNLEFYVNGQIRSYNSGKTAWSQYIVFLGSTNQYTLKWRYVRAPDEYEGAGSVPGTGTAWLDQLSVMQVPYAANVPQLFFQNSSGLLVSWVLDTNSVFQFARLLANVQGWQLKTTGDVNRDGVDDLVFQNASGDTILWYMNADGSYRGAQYLGNTGTWSVQGCTDYNNDGMCELFFQQPNGATAYWTLDANGVFKGATNLGNLNTWRLKGGADLNGDGRSELFWQRPDGMTVAWFYNSDGSVRGQVVGNMTPWTLRHVANLGTCATTGGLLSLIWQNPSSATVGWTMDAAGARNGAVMIGNSGAWQFKAAGK